MMFKPDLSHDDRPDHPRLAMFSISDQGLINERECPLQALDDSAGRRHAVVQALEILAPIVRPLALEITLGPMDPETFAVTTAESRRLASSAIPAGVAHQSAFAHSAEIEVVDSLTSDAVLRALTPREAGWEFSTIVTLVTSARVYVSDLVLERMPSLPVPTLEADGGRWVVGPLDAPGYRLLPPIRLTWRQEWGDLSLAIEAFWSLWWQTDSAEYAALRAAEQALDAAGFTVRR